MIFLNIFTFLFSFQIYSSVEFFCWTEPEFPVVQAVEIAVQTCESESKMVGSTAQDVNEKEVMCVHTVACEPLTENFKNYILSETDKKSISEFTDEEIYLKARKKNYGKTAVLNCRGKYKKEFGRATVECPEPNECLDDIFYNFVLASTSRPEKKQFKVNPVKEQKGTK